MKNHIRLCLIPLIVIISWIVSISCVIAQEVSHPEPAVKEETQVQETLPDEYPVILNNKVLFVFKNAVGPITAKKRAHDTSEKLEKIAKDYSLQLDKITVLTYDEGMFVQLGEISILFITSLDAKNNKTTKLELANQYIASIKKGITDYRKDYSFNNILMGLLYTFIATLFLIGTFRFIIFVIKNLSTFIENRYEAGYIQSLHFQKFQILSSRKILLSLKLFINIVLILLLLLIIGIYLSVVLSFFPWTASQSGQFLSQTHHIVSTIISALVSYLPSLLMILVILTISLFIIKFLKVIFSEIKKGTIEFTWFYPDWADTTKNLLTILVVCFTVALVYPYLPGSDTKIFKGVSILIGVLFSIGSTSALANIISGIILTYTRAFLIGERVEITGYKGDVVAKTLFVTRLKTFKNEIVSIPNSKVISSEIKNFNTLGKQGDLILYTEITIGYDVPWQKVHQLLINAALETTNIIREKTPYVLQKSLNDFTITYEINVFTDKPEFMPLIYSELHQNIQNKFNEAGVEIMSPTFHSLRDGNKTTIPDTYLKEDYSRPSFKVNIEENKG